MFFCFFKPCALNIGIHEIFQTLPQTGGQHEPFVRGLGINSEAESSSRLKRATTIDVTVRFSVLALSDGELIPRLILTKPQSLQL